MTIPTLQHLWKVQIFQIIRVNKNAPMPQSPHNTILPSVSLLSNWNNHLQVVKIYHSRQTKNLSIERWVIILHTIFITKVSPIRNFMVVFRFIWCAKSNPITNIILGKIWVFTNTMPCVSNTFYTHLPHRPKNHQYLKLHIFFQISQAYNFSSTSSLLGDIVYIWDLSSSKRS